MLVEVKNLFSLSNSDFFFRSLQLTTHTDGQFECHMCSKKYSNKKELEVHADICNDRRFSCEFCVKKFKFLRSAQDHKKRFHQSNDPLCNAIVDGTDFTEGKKSNSVEEMNLEKSSGANSALQHQGVSVSCNAKCPYCVKSYRTKGLLSRHISQFHEPYACDICGLTFANGAKASYHKVC